LHRRAASRGATLAPLPQLMRTPTRADQGQERTTDGPDGRRRDAPLAPDRSLHRALDRSIPGPWGCADPRI